jgi:hypothetical protein
LNKQLTWSPHKLQIVWRPGRLLKPSSSPAGQTEVEMQGDSHCTEVDARFPELL